MAKLKDIFPRWLFRERGYGELEVGGASAFAHLVEDADNGAIFLTGVGWGLVVNNAGDWTGTQAALYEDGSIQAVAADANHGGLSMQTTGDAAARVIMRPDGSIHWGDGTAAPTHNLVPSVADGEFEFSGGWDVVNHGAGVGARLDDWSSYSFIHHDGRIEQIVATPADLWVNAIQVNGEAYPRFIHEMVGGVLRLRMGDGTSGPDTTLQRAEGFPALVLNDPDGNGFYVAKAGDAAGDNSWIGPGGAAFHAGTDDVEIIPNQTAAIKIDRHGAGLLLVSPDGLTSKTVTINNAGALTLV